MLCLVAYVTSEYGDDTAITHEMLPPISAVEKAIILSSPEAAMYLPYLSAFPSTILFSRSKLI